MPKPCNVDGCNNPRWGKGYCSHHQYLRTDKKKKSNYIKPISDKKAEELKIYREVRDKYMANHEICEYGNCSSLANDLHHKAGRGKETTNVKHFMAVCRNHHTYIHLNPKESRALGYLI